MIEDYAKYSANTGLGNVSTANTGLDGGGALTTVLTAAGNGTLVRNVILKAQVSISSGDIIRLFFSPDGDSIYLLEEILFRPTGGGSGSVFATCQVKISLNFLLKSGYTLLVSTDIAKKFSVSVEGLDWSYP